MLRIPPALAVLAALGAALALAPPATAAFDLGVAAGDVGSTSALVWTSAGAPGPVTLEYARGSRLRSRPTRIAATAGEAGTVTVRLTGLTPGSAYRYRFVAGSRHSPTGRFRTAPPIWRNAPVRFAISGDADAQPAPGAAGPFYNGFEVYGRMSREGNDFNINLGDTIYSDSEVPGAGTPALTVEAKRAKYRQNLALAPLREMRARAATFSHFDDHEFVNDFSQAEHGRALYDAGVQAFREFAPVTWSRTKGLYRRARWGRNVELFFLDERSFRDAKASAGGTCDSPSTGQPDIAPTAPQRTRSFFALLVPSLADPPPPGCVARIEAPGRAFLGSRQVTRFLDDVSRSHARFKVVVSETPIQQFYALPYDRWEGYAAERAQVLSGLLARHVRNLVFLTTDTHATMIGEVRTRTLEDGGPVSTGYLEAVTGPVATMTYRREIDAIAGAGAGEAVERAFLKPPPPQGIGMQCAQTDAYSYLEVTVSSRRLTIAPKAIDGAALSDAAGRCGPYVVSAR